MKKLFFSVLALSMTLFVNAQLVDVASVEKVTPQGNLNCQVATISPDGSFAIVGAAGGQTLTKVDLADGATTVVTNNGNVNGVTISPDGNNVVFRTTSFNNRLRYTGLASVNLANGQEKVLVAPSRRLNAGVAVTATGVTAVENGQIRVNAFGGARAAAAPVASINYGHLDITVNGTTTTIDPNGRGSYLWPSISPDGTKVVYCLSGAGTFVCNLDGSNVKRIGNIRAAKWLGNNLVVGMNDQDNGETFVSSSIVVSNLNGQMQTLTGANVIAMYPSASVDCKKVAFTTPAGELYIVNLK